MLSIILERSTTPKYKKKTKKERESERKRNRKVQINCYDEKKN